MGDVQSKERWQPIVGFEGYEVSDHGRVRSWLLRGPRSGGLRRAEPRIIRLEGNGVSLRLDGRSVYRDVHRLSREAFGGPADPADRTAEIQRQVIDAMRSGSTAYEAADAHGSDKHRVWRWVIKGRAGDPLHADFAAAYDALRAEQEAARARRRETDPLGHRRSVLRQQERRRELRSASAGVVYFIHAPSVGRVKIGFTSLDREIAGRLSSLQTGSPVPLVLLGSAPGTLEHERLAHRAWADERTHGEWFRCTPPLLEFIERALVGGIEAALVLAAPRPVSGGVGRCKLSAEQVAEIRQRHDRPDPPSIASTARAFGVTSKAISNVLRREAWANAG